MTSNPIIWLLLDNRPGNNNQVKGVAEALRLPTITKQLAYTPFIRLPNSIRKRSLIGLTSATKAALKSPWPDIVIAAGRRSAPVLRYIKHASNGKAFTVQLMWPDIVSGDFDLIALSYHDKPRQGRHIVRTVAVPNHINAPLLEEKKHAWLPTFSIYKKPYISVLIGGGTRRTHFTAHHAKELATTLNAIVNQHGGTPLITTSRRTPSKVIDVLKETLLCDYFLYDWRDASAENPYLGLMAVADIIIATGDSMSMCSESCSTTKPVFVYAPDDLITPKYRRLHRHLFELGRMFPVEDLLNNPMPTAPMTPLQDATIVASAILARTS